MGQITFTKLSGRFCRVTDNRHKDFEEKLAAASLAESFEEEPVVFEACIEQVTILLLGLRRFLLGRCNFTNISIVKVSEAFVQISVPLAKFMTDQRMQIKLGNLMIQKACENRNGENASSAESTSMMLQWTLRSVSYYFSGDVPHQKGLLSRESCFIFRHSESSTFPERETFSLTLCNQIRLRV